MTRHGLRERIVINSFIYTFKSHILNTNGKVEILKYEYNYTLVILAGRPTEKRPLGKSRRRWEDNIRMDLKEIGI